MRRVLIITYYWPPTGGSGVQRWVKFAKYLPSLGWQPVVYTPSNPEQLAVDESLMAEIPSEVEVLKRPIREPYAFYRRLVGGGASKGAGVNPINSQKKTWKQRLMLWIRSNLFVPDPRAGWVRPSVGYLCRYLSEHPVDVIVTTGPPQSVHLIGRGLHRKIGVPWVADFRDPWTRMFFFKDLPMLPFVRRRHVCLEKSVLDEATVVVSVTPRVQADFASMTSTPVHLITNGYDESDFSAELPPRTDGKFRIVHTGLFASDGNPLELWKSLAGLCSESADFASRLEIRLAGKVDPEIVDSITEAGLGAQLHLLGYLPHSESVAELRQADIILMPLRQAPEYSKVYPGKIFECMAAGPIVLGIGPTDSAAAELLTSTGTGVMVDWSADPSELIRAAADERESVVTAGGCWYRAPSSGARTSPSPAAEGKSAAVATSAADGRAAAYSRMALAARMSELLTSIAK